MNRRIRIKKGLDIPLAGPPQQAVQAGNEIQHVALCGPDYIGLKPRLMVAEGDEVEAGQTLFIDKRDPDVPYCSPGTGTVAAINRGARRALQSVVVRLASQEAEPARFEQLSTEQIEALDTPAASDRLQKSGLWTAFRTRPFGRVPLSGTQPHAIFVTAVDTRPLAADPRVVVEADSAGFASGLRVLKRLTQGRVYLCTGADWSIELPAIEGLETVAFEGPHPAGLAGTHMHHLAPVGADRTCWHIGYQDVIAIGRLFSEGAVRNDRVVALGGSDLKKPRLVKTRLGASVQELLEDETLRPEGCRHLSGSALDGRAAEGGLAYLGRYHDQLTSLREGGDRHFLGWLGLLSRKFTATSVRILFGGRGKRRSISTSQNGRYTGMIPLRVFERVMPLDILPSPLFRALMVRDTDRAQELGCLELSEEDLALSSFVCPAKYDYGAVLRTNLDQIEREG